MPVEVEPPVTEFGFRVRLESTGELIVSVADLEPLNVPEIVAEVGPATELVDTAKPCVLAPAGTVTVLDTTAAALLLESVMTAPPLGAALVSVTVPVDVAPPVTEVGFNVRVEIAGAFIVSVADLEPL